ncbi:MAG TPA: plastocyanin/azurin family copper-binding protein [Candidatus Polarisedimenticolaceae bacterium]|nr:plastocyanin/azurin family copper-binding protein [Candidatus Polarisedimenticolaceae bacterium]
MFLAATTLLIAVLPGLAEDPVRFAPREHLDVGRADWLALDGGLIAYGAGSRVRVARTGPRLLVEGEWTVDGPVVDGVIAGRTLYLNLGGTRLAQLQLDQPAPAVQPIPLAPAPRGALRLARLVDHLAVAEQGVGLRLIELPSHHGGGFRQVGLLPFEPAVGAIAAEGTRVALGLAGTSLVAVVDASDPSAPVLERTIDVGGPASALALADPTLYLLGSDGLWTAQIAGERAGTRSAPQPAQGTGLVVSGRSVYTALGDLGLRTFEDRAPAAIFNVTVGDIFFQPDTLTIQVGDIVRWNNAAAGLTHNVESCDGASGSPPGNNVDPPFCTGLPVAADGFFTSGTPAASFTFSRTFVNAGVNPYFCEVHTTFGMNGTITVQAVGPPPPPGVTDRAPGIPMLVNKADPSGSTLVVSWDTSCADAASYQLVYGGRGQLPATLAGTYSLTGAQCGVPAPSPYTWVASPDPALDPSRLIWFLMLAVNQTNEGSWSRNTAGERAGPGTNGCSAQCGITDKLLTNVCGQ